MYFVYCRVLGVGCRVKADWRTSLGRSVGQNLGESARFDCQFEPESQQYEPAPESNPPWRALPRYPRVKQAQNHIYTFTFLIVNFEFSIRLVSTIKNALELISDGIL